MKKENTIELKTGDCNPIAKIEYFSCDVINQISISTSM